MYYDWRSIGAIALLRKTKNIDRFAIKTHVGIDFPSFETLILCSFIFLKKSTINEYAHKRVH